MLTNRPMSRSSSLTSSALVLSVPSRYTRYELDTVENTPSGTFPVITPSLRMEYAFARSSPSSSSLLLDPVVER